MRCPWRTSWVPGAEEWLLLPPAPRHRSAFGLLGALCSEPSDPPPHCGCGQVRISAAGTSTSPLAASQELQCSSSPPTQCAAMQAGQEGERCCRSTRQPPPTGTPLGWDMVCAGAAVDAKGDELPLLMLLPYLGAGKGCEGLWYPQPGPDLSSGCKPRVLRDRTRSQLSPKITILTVCFTPSPTAVPGREAATPALLHLPES